MTREEVQKLSYAITHFAKGGNLWWYNPSSNTWTIQTKLWCSRYDMENDGIINIIEDKHFEIRKAHALGAPIQCKDKVGKWDWHDTDAFGVFQDQYEFRIKPKEPVYEWQWIYVNKDGIINNYTTKPYSSYKEGWIKFEPSKRLRK